MMRTNSIVYKLAFQLTVILVILFFIMILSNVYSLNVVQTHSLTSSQNTLRLYKVTIQNSLENFSTDLIEIFENYIDSAVNFENLDETGQYFNSLELKNALMMKMTRKDSSDLMFIKIESSDTLLIYYGYRIDAVNKLILSDYLHAYSLEYEEEKSYDEWSSMELGDQSYVYRAIHYSGITFGTIVQASTLFTLVNHGEYDDSSYVLSNIEGEILTTYNLELDQVQHLDLLHEQLSHYYLINEDTISKLGTITYVVEKQNIFSGLQAIQWIIISLGVLSIVVVPLVIRSLTRDILKPILELVKASKEVEKGGTHFLGSTQLYSMEFMKLFHSFQSMVHEITDLKIQSYEDELNKNHLQLKYLQMQIRPHFFLNAISTITSLTYQNKNEDIRRLIQYLSEHLRYMFIGGLTEIQISDEIKHVENYIQMQEIRYPNQIFFMKEIDENIGQVMIPHFIIQTFVENIFKHAMFYGETLAIFLRVTMEEKNNLPFIRITLEDNGEGFNLEWLKQLASEQSDYIENKYQVGINNINRTLQLLYKRNDLLQLSNVEPSGAKVELWIPIQLNKSE